jgi:hypothetical protein
LSTLEKTVGDLRHKHDRANVFVVGDLVIDHTVFVIRPDATKPQPASFSGEEEFQVIRRLDTAGGAATTARLLSALSEGTTYLWGVVGTSPWGTFRESLHNSQSIDGAKRHIELRGVRDETDAPIATVSRLVEVVENQDGNESYVRRGRFIEFGLVHIPAFKRHSVLYHLKRAHATKTQFDAIVLNDFSLGTLRSRTIKRINRFAGRAKIPIFLRIRTNGSRYRRVALRGLVCTLKEWVRLVDDDRGAAYWLSNYSNAAHAAEIARRSLYLFPGAQCIAILIGDAAFDGCVLIGPSAPDTLERRVVSYRIDGWRRSGSHQIGTSDVVAAAFFVGLGFERESISFAGAESALRHAVGIADAYQHSGWHRVPPREAASSTAPLRLSRLRDIHSSFGTAYLPPGDRIVLKEAHTLIEGQLSVTETVRDMIKALHQSVMEDAGSVVLVAPGGMGKTELGKALIDDLKSAGVVAGWHRDIVEDAKHKWDWRKPQDIIRRIRAHSPGDNRCLVIVDEATKLKGSEAMKTQGVVLLNAAATNNIRFLFIDADFANSRGLESQFGNRCVWHKLPGIVERPRDIPYVLANCLLRKIGDGGDDVLSVETAVVVGLIEWMLTYRKAFRDLDKIAQAAIKEKARAREVVSSASDKKMFRREHFRIPEGPLEWPDLVWLADVMTVSY